MEECSVFGYRNLDGLLSQIHYIPTNLTETSSFDVLQNIPTKVFPCAEIPFSLSTKEGASSALSLHNRSSHFSSQASTSVDDLQIIGTKLPEAESPFIPCIEEGFSSPHFTSQSVQDHVDVPSKGYLEKYSMNEHEDGACLRAEDETALPFVLYVKVRLDS